MLVIFRRFFPVLVLTVVALTGFFALQTGPQAGTPRFEAHEFALFRSNYESLRIQSSQSRAAHFRSLTSTAENAQLTTGMAEALVEFCQTVIASEDETPEVKAEVRTAIAALEMKLPASSIDTLDHRRPASMIPTQR